MQLFSFANFNIPCLACIVRKSCIGGNVNSRSNDSSDNSNIGLIAGIAGVIAAILVVMIIVIIICIIVCLKKKGSYCHIE